MLSCKIKVLLTYVLPHHLISRAMGYLVRCKTTVVKNTLIKMFIARYRVNMQEALHEDINAYENFCDFFTRPLKPYARNMINNRNVITSPVDGVISQIGDINQQSIIQAKGKDFSVATLLGGNLNVANKFENGKFATLYLAPKDYHRIHMPISGKLKQTIYVPGRLFSVGPVAASMVDNLFARNERLVCIFETAVGDVAMVLVGAIYVASINTSWGGTASPPCTSQIKTIDFKNSGVTLQQNQEMGFFNLGSTVILLFPENSISWEQQLQADDEIKLGMSLGQAN